MKLDTKETLETTICVTCGMTFAVPEHWLQIHCREQGRGFYCPAGHGLSYGEGELAKTRDELAKQKQLREQAEAQAAEARALAEAAEKREKRLKARAAAGKCPCCARNFTNLRRHIATKHPDLAETRG